MNKNKKGLKLSVLSLVAILIAYIIIDYLNLPKILGLDITNVNMDLFEILFNSFIIVLFYIITYFVIDKKQVEKENNAKRTARILMSLSYKRCEETISLFDNNEMIRRYIVPKVDFNDTNNNFPVVQALQNKSFTEYEHILQLAGSGYINDKRFERYLSFMSEYKEYISLKITFFDIDTVEKPKRIQIEMKNHIIEIRKSLFNTIIKELELLRNDEE